MINSKKKVLILVVTVIVVLLYLGMTYILKNYFISNIPDREPFKNNEFGDFVGGLVNPLFTLLSTIAIIYLTYTIAKNENEKAEKAIEIQKRLTLNQMRQMAFESLMQKTNMYIHEIDKLAIHEAKNKFIQLLHTGNIKNQNKENERVTVWLVILSEIENFIQFKYLFSELFNKNEFIVKHQEIIDITSKLCEEQSTYLFVKTGTLENYVQIQNDFLTIIGNYIYSEF